MTGVRPAQLAPTFAQPSVLVIGDAAGLHRQASRLLGDAGFYPLSGVWSGAELRTNHALTERDLVLYLSREDAARRIDSVRALIQAHPYVRLIVSMPDASSSAQLRRVLRTGVAGLVIEGELDEVLVPTAQAVRSGQLAVPFSLRKQMAPRALSFREKQILGLVVMGFTNREIADKLFLAESTVKTHLSSAFAKLDTRNRAEAAAVILDPDEGYGLGILAITSDQQSSA